MERAERARARTRETRAGRSLVGRNAVTWTGAWRGTWWHSWCHHSWCHHSWRHHSWCHRSAARVVRSSHSKQRAKTTVRLARSRTMEILESCPSQEGTNVLADAAQPHLGGVFAVMAGGLGVWKVRDRGGGLEQLQQVRGQERRHPRPGLRFHARVWVIPVSV